MTTTGSIVLTALRRAAILCPATALLVLVSAGPLFAHAGFKGNITSVPAGAVQTFILDVPIEPFEFSGQIPDEANFFTEMVETEIPRGWSIESCAPKTGWKCVIAQGQITWTNESGAANGFDTEFTFSARTAPSSGSYYFRTLQTYNSGCSPAPCLGHWNREGGELNPAPKITLVAGPNSTGVTGSETPSPSDSPAASDPQADTGRGGSGLFVILGVAGALIVLGAAAVRSRRRKQ